MNKCLVRVNLYVSYDLEFPTCMHHHHRHRILVSRSDFSARLEIAGCVYVRDDETSSVAI